MIPIEKVEEPINICHIMCRTNPIPGQFSLHLPSFGDNVQARRQPPACLRRLQPVLRDAARPPQRMVHSRREDRLERRRDPVRGMLQVWQGASRRSAASGHGGADHPEAHGAKATAPWWRRQPRTRATSSSSAFRPSRSSARSPTARRPFSGAASRRRC